MTGWMLATLGFLPPAVAALLAARRGQAAQRLVAVQLATALASLLLALMTWAFDLPGTLLMALFLERWL